jgi:hypothetical protein
MHGQGERSEPISEREENLCAGVQESLALLIRS